MLLYVYLGNCIEIVAELKLGHLYIYMHYGEHHDMEWRYAVSFMTSSGYSKLYIFLKPSCLVWVTTSHVLRDVCWKYHFLVASSHVTHFSQYADHLSGRIYKKWMLHTFDFFYVPTFVSMKTGCFWYWGLLIKWAVRSRTVMIGYPDFVSSLPLIDNMSWREGLCMEWLHL